jgi:predicted transcriptional regulator
MTVSKVVKLDSNINARLKELGLLQQRSTHWLMKQAILHYLEREEARERLKHQTLERWQEVAEGKIVQNKAVMEWLDTWGASSTSERPKCEN